MSGSEDVVQQLKAVSKNLEAVKDKLSDAEKTLAKNTERKCEQCSATIRADEEALCEDCARVPDCDACAGSITDGYCGTCHNKLVVAAEEEAQGHYPSMGVARVGPVEDQLLDFLRLVSEDCCRDEPRCQRCVDAAYFKQAYEAKLAVR